MKSVQANKQKREKMEKMKEERKKKTKEKADNKSRKRQSGKGNTKKQKRKKGKGKKKKIRKETEKEKKQKNSSRVRRGSLKKNSRSNSRHLSKYSKAGGTQAWCASTLPLAKGVEWSHYAPATGSSELLLITDSKMLVMLTRQADDCEKIHNVRFQAITTKRGKPDGKQTHKREHPSMAITETLIEDATKHDILNSFITQIDNDGRFAHMNQPL
ncbi:leucine-rich repeat-containing protein 59 [Striga asiatica]|uniref:Leucine-rich repeat-containing protein 59 n=1 Tax=Striga asiatica TaxID=4170 RepID=A0A5A7RAY4_STRAF|nr:leucine-rich repeat-containing protein 59 [Striga asiatica]